MGCRRVTDLVHTLDDGVKRRVITDCGVRAVKVIVNRAWQTDDRDVIFPGEILRPRKGSVASDNDQRVNSELHEIVVGLLASFHRHELLAAGGLQNRSAPLDGVADTFCRKFLEITVDETFVAAIDTHNLPSVVDRRAGHGPDGRIHSRSVST